MMDIPRGLGGDGSPQLDLRAGLLKLVQAAPPTAEAWKAAIDGIGSLLDERDALRGRVEELTGALRPLAEYPVMESMRGRDAWICRADAPNGKATGISVEAVFVARAALARVVPEKETQ